MVQRERRIEEIAYLLWEQEGRPDGQAERFWHAAEAQFEAEVARAELSAAVAEAPSEGAALKKREPAKANAGGEEHEKAVRTAKPKAAKAPAAPPAKPKTVEAPSVAVKAMASEPMAKPAAKRSTTTKSKPTA